MPKNSSKSTAVAPKKFHLRKIYIAASCFQQRRVSLGQAQGDGDLVKARAGDVRTIAALRELGGEQVSAAPRIGTSLERLQNYRRPQPQRLIFPPESIEQPMRAKNFS